MDKDADYGDGNEHEDVPDRIEEPHRRHIREYLAHT